MIEVVFPHLQLCSPWHRGMLTLLRWFVPSAWRGMMLRQLHQRILEMQPPEKRKFLIFKASSHGLGNRIAGTEDSCCWTGLSLTLRHIVTRSEPCRCMCWRPIHNDCLFGRILSPSIPFPNPTLNCIDVPKKK